MPRVVETLATYLPSIIVNFLIEDNKDEVAPPEHQSFETCCLFADVSGFTALSEKLAAKGSEGAELLAKHLNSYFEQMVKTIAGSGGDVFKFAGDAMLVLWPPSDEGLAILARRGAQCGMDIQEALHNVQLDEGVSLSVKIGVGVGMINVLHIGGTLHRMEYIATGEPLIQAFHAEHQAVAGNVICSPEAWNLVKEHFQGTVLPGGEKQVLVEKVINPLRKKSVVQTIRKEITSDQEDKVMRKLRQYVPAAAYSFLDSNEEFWGGELRYLTVMFVNLGFTESEMNNIATQGATEKIQKVLCEVQQCVYQYEGSLNKFLMDDKGSTLIAVFGLPPMAHEDDATRAVLASIAICSKLQMLGLHPAVGITTGIAFCGVLGTHTRREYSVMGDTVNLSARLMQKATVSRGGVLCDAATCKAAQGRLVFEKLPEINVKGKTETIEIFRPYPRLSTFYASRAQTNPATNARQSLTPEVNSTTGSSERHVRPTTGNMMGDILRYQIEEYSLQNALRLRGYESRRRSTVSAIPEASSLVMPQRGGSGTIDVLKRRSSTERLPDIAEDGGPPLRKPPSGPLSVMSTSPIGARIVIPNRGHITVQCSDLTYVSQLKERAFEQAKRRRALEGNVALDRCALRYGETGFYLREDCTLQNLYNGQGLGFTFLEVRLEEKGKDGPDLSTLVPHERIKYSLLQKVHGLLVDKQPSTVVVEGDMGVGKTKMIATTLGELTIRLLCAACNPFEINVPFSAWRGIFAQIIDEEMEVNPDIGDREQMLKHILDLAVGSEGVDYIGSLIEVLWDPDYRPNQTIELPAGQTLEKVHLDLFVQMLRLLTSRTPAVIVIDDVLYMDAASWKLVLAVSQQKIPGIFLVLSTRPFKTYAVGRSYLFNETKPMYEMLKRQEGTEIFAMGTLDDRKMDEIIKDCINVHKIEPNLLNLLKDKVRGNPFWAREIARELLRNNIISVDADGARLSDISSTAPNSNPLVKAMDPSYLPLPPVAYKYISARVDKLSRGQAMLLKVASTIGKEFKVSLLAHAHPLDRYKTSIKDDLKALEDLQLIRRARLNNRPTDRPVSPVVKPFVPVVTGAVPPPPPPPPEPTPPDEMYSFTIGFMREVIYRQMLFKQRKTVEKVVKEFQSAIESENRKSMIHSELRAINESTRRHCGFVHIRKDNKNKTMSMMGSNYKKRWLVLTDECLIMNRDASDKKAVGIINLREASIETVSGLGTKDRDTSFRIGTNYWTKKKEQNHTHRYFYMSAPSVQEAEEWKSAIQQTIDALKRKLNPSMATNSETNEDYHHAQDTANDIASEWADSFRRTSVHRRSRDRLSTVDQVSRKNTTEILEAPESVESDHDGESDNLDSAPSIMDRSPGRSNSLKVTFTDDRTLSFGADSPSLSLNLNFDSPANGPRRSSFGHARTVSNVSLASDMSMLTDSTMSNASPTRKQSDIYANNQEAILQDLLNEALAITEENDASEGQIKAVLQKAVALISRPKHFVHRQQTATFSPGPALTEMLMSSNYLDENTKRWLNSMEYLHSLSSDPSQQLLTGSALHQDPTRDWSVSIEDNFPQTSSALSAEVRASLRSWNFNLFQYKEEELTQFVVHAFMHFDMFNLFGVQHNTFQNFLRGVKEGYLSKPYHNFAHGFDAMQAVYTFLTSMKASSYIATLEMFAFLIAALCHDINHNGLTNAYHVNAQTDLAILHNDQSVLENHHCAYLFQLLRQPNCNILGSLKQSEFRHVRKIIISSILATDMAFHFSLTEQLHKLVEVMLEKNIISKEPPPPPPVPGTPPPPIPPAAVTPRSRSFRLNSGLSHPRSPSMAAEDAWTQSTHPRTESNLTAAERETFIKILMHSADVSNPCRPWDLSKKWSDLLVEEFFNQGDRERAENLPVSPNMDRSTSKQSQLSLNFVDFVVGPLFATIAQILPEAEVCCTHMTTNRQTWEEIRENERESDTPKAKSAGSPIQLSKSQEQVLWKRRKTAFHEVIGAGAIKSTESPSRSSGSNPSVLETFMEALQQDEDDSTEQEV